MYTISVLLKEGRGQKDIAAAIGVSPSTISRELHRNGSAAGVYGYRMAQRKADGRKRAKPGNRSLPMALKMEAVGLLVGKQWSPEQISGVMAGKENIP